MQKPKISNSHHSRRSCNFMWTLNNYTEEEVALLQSIDCKYMTWGYEVGESGTPHLQGTTIFSSKKSVKQIIDLLPIRVSNIQIIAHLFKEIKYCHKDGNIYENGAAPVCPAECGDGEIARWETARTLAKENRLDEIDADIYIRSYGTLKVIAKDHMKAVASNVVIDNRWICGPTGCGKSYGVAKEFPGAYPKMCNKWWDGYQGEDTVVIEDLDENHKCLVHHLKLWADHGAFLAETKGGVIKIRPKRIIVTSNCRISDIAEGVHLNALERRFKVTDHFNPNYSSNFSPITEIK